MLRRKRGGLDPTRSDGAAAKVGQEGMADRKSIDERSSSAPRPDPEPPGWRIEGQPEPEAPKRTSPFRLGRFWLILAALLLLNILIVSLLPDRTDRLSVPYTTFREEVARGNVQEITSEGDTIQGEFRAEITFPGPEDTLMSDPPETMTSDLFETERPAFADDELIQLLIDNDVIVNARPPDTGRSLLATILLSFGPVVLLVFLFVFLLRQIGGAGGALAGLGRSRAKRYEASGQCTTFNDVAGIDDAEEELVEVVDFLRNPQKYRKLGASIPKGVLLSGPPGTGKTLLARTVAGEANVPFFSLSASEFVEMIVGVGASRVRDLFNQAKEAAPAIIFIDELDAIGRSRGGGGSIGGHDEREQTLNQILTEMDGFTGTEGVIVLAATNRPEVLDSALLRPGRFDRRVVVNPPDQIGRTKILEVHSRNVPVADDVDLDALASTTPGMVGADLRNLVNEAVLMAARRDHEQVHLGDFTDALEKIILGAERRIMISQEERERTAYHESGHAIVGMLQPGADPVRKVSIVPRGRALGVTFQAPEADRYGYGEKLRREVSSRSDHRCARRSGRRGDRVRRGHDRRRVRPRAGDAYRPPDGWALGHVGRRRPRLGAARPAGRAAALPGSRAGVRADPGARRQRGATHRRRVVLDELRCPPAGRNAVGSDEDVVVLPRDRDQLALPWIAGMDADQLELREVDRDGVERAREPEVAL